MINDVVVVVSVVVVRWINTKPAYDQRDDEKKEICYPTYSHISSYKWANFDINWG